MKKIPTLFVKVYNKDHTFTLTDNVTPGFKWVLNGEGIATVKWDGACCAVVDGIFCKRYDAKKGKKPPANAIPCQKSPDPVTGHWPHWLPVSEDNNADKWFLAAYKNTPEYFGEEISDGIFDKIVDNLTYEAVGPHFQGNPYNLSKDILIAHGMDYVNLQNRSFKGIKEYLENNNVEGIVFWKDGIPQCKIKRRDFGFKWPVEM